MHESTHPAFAEPAARVEEIPEPDRGPDHGPEPAGESGRTRSLKRLRSPFSAEVGTILAIVAAAAYVYLLRRPSGLQAPVMFAEDGTVFFKDAIERGLGALFAPYNGQIFIPQRLVATLGSERAQLPRLRRIGPQESPCHPDRSQRRAPGQDHAPATHGGELETATAEIGDDAVEFR